MAQNDPEASLRNAERARGGERCAGAAGHGREHQTAWRGSALGSNDGEVDTQTNAGGECFSGLSADYTGCGVGLAGALHEKRPIRHPVAAQTRDATCRRCWSGEPHRLRRGSGGRRQKADVRAEDARVGSTAESRSGRCTEREMQRTRSRQTP